MSRYWVTNGPIMIAVPNQTVPKVELSNVLEGACLCGGELDRAAFREPDGSRRWVAFGYRCNSCGTLYTEPIE